LEIIDVDLGIDSSHEHPELLRIESLEPSGLDDVRQSHQERLALQLDLSV
jgi:hypothetical protein